MTCFFKKIVELTPYLYPLGESLVRISRIGDDDD
jgi:hypothetical protein